MYFYILTVYKINSNPTCSLSLHLNLSFIIETRIAKLHVLLNNNIKYLLWYATILISMIVAGSFSKSGVLPLNYPIIIEAWCISTRVYKLRFLHALHKIMFRRGLEIVS